MDDDKTNLIYAKWRILVRTMKLTVRNKNDHAYVTEEWCPIHPTADDITQLRPELRDIFKQAMEGTLVKEGHSNRIVRLGAFFDLLHTVHDGSKPAPEVDLVVWSVREIDGATRSMWTGIDDKSKMYLRHCMRNYLSFEVKMDDLDNRMARWMKSAGGRLNNMRKLSAKADLQRAIKPRHRETIELGEARYEDVGAIRDKIPLEVQNFKTKFQEAILDVLFNSVDISEVPEWSEEMTAIQERNESVIPDYLTLQVDAPRDDDKDGPLEKLAAHYENLIGYNETMREEEEEFWDEVRKL